MRTAAHAVLMMALAGPVAAQSDDSAIDMLNSLAGDCTPLSAGVKVCDVWDLGWLNYSPVEGGRLSVAIGDTTATMGSGTADLVTADMSEARRREVQARLLQDFAASFLAGRGVAPADVAVGHVLAVPVGNDGADRPARLETMIIGEAGQETTHGITVFLDQTHFVYMLSNNRGSTASEDHFFAVEELMRAVEMPQ
ncbi:hypothetical protein [Salibaculum halophilum]|uniref:hypothetical protein n=1 Tax=Salibaculum halophilum TaxID=1914408 RepID=UPI000A120DF8|nr:hypothetical protein [Salibaculum halophilum]